MTCAIAILALGALTIPTTVDARGVHVREVRLQDRCDPASFNAVFGTPENPVICVPHGGQLITVDKFLAKLNPTDGGHPKWNNHPDELDLRSGDEISVTVRGGEFHTFTEVPVTDELVPGCLPDLNAALGLGAGPTDAQCTGPGGIFATSGVAADGGSTLNVSGLADGEHLFMCFIHPWMRTVVEVGDDDD